MGLAGGCEALWGGGRLGGACSCCSRWQSSRQLVSDGLSVRAGRPGVQPSLVAAEFGVRRSWCHRLTPDRHDQLAAIWSGALDARTVRRGVDPPGGGGAGAALRRSGGACRRVHPSPPPCAAANRHPEINCYPSPGQGNPCEMFIKKKMWLGKVRGRAPRSKLPLPSFAGGAATPAMRVLPANRCSHPCVEHGCAWSERASFGPPAVPHP